MEAKRMERNWWDFNGVDQAMVYWFVCIYNQRSWSHGVSDHSNKKNLTDDEVMQCGDIARHFHDRLMLFVCLIGACGISASLKMSFWSWHVPNAGSKLICSLISDLNHEISELATKLRLCKWNSWLCTFTFTLCLLEFSILRYLHAAQSVSAWGAANEAGHIAMFQFLAARISTAV